MRPGLTAGDLGPSIVSLNTNILLLLFLLLLLYVVHLLYKVTTCKVRLRFFVSCLCARYNVVSQLFDIYQNFYCSKLRWTACAGQGRASCALGGRSRKSCATTPPQCRSCLLYENLCPMMMILLLFLQKQNLAFAVYQFGSVLSLPD